MDRFCINGWIDLIAIDIGMDSYHATLSPDNSPMMGLGTAWMGPRLKKTMMMRKKMNTVAFSMHRLGESDCNVQMSIIGMK
jgi:hypothetical protein